MYKAFDRTSSIRCRPLAPRGILLADASDAIPAPGADPYQFPNQAPAAAIFASCGCDLGALRGGRGKRLTVRHAKLRFWRQIRRSK